MVLPGTFSSMACCRFQGGSFAAVPFELLGYVLKGQINPSHSDATAEDDTYGLRTNRGKSGKFWPDRSNYIPLELPKSVLRTRCQRLWIAFSQAVFWAGKTNELMASQWQLEARLRRCAAAPDWYCYSCSEAKAQHTPISQELAGAAMWPSWSWSES